MARARDLCAAVARRRRETCASVRRAAAGLVAIEPGTLGAPARPRRRLCRVPSAGLLLLTLQDGRWEHARLRTGGRTRVRLRSAHRRRREQDRRPVLVGVRDVPVAEPRVRRETAYV